MSMMNYISSAAMPIIILLIIIYGIVEKNKIFDTFLNGAEEGAKIVFKIFPTLVGLFVAIGALRASGIIDMVVNFLTPILSLLKIPSEIMPLALLRPISGSGSLAIATDIMKRYGVDSHIRINCIYNYGVNRNNAVYNCNLYKLCWNKEYKVCIVDITCSRLCRYCNICNNMEYYRKLN